jgi:hypothetical protein
MNSACESDIFIAKKPNVTDFSTIERQWKEQYYQCVRYPLGEYGHRHCGAADAVWKDLWHERPEDGADAGSEKSQVNEYKDEYDWAVKGSSSREQRQYGQCTCHPERTKDIQGLSSLSINRPERGQGEDKVCQANNEGREQRGIDFPAGRPEDRGRVVDDRIYAGDVYQDREAETNYDSPAYPRLKEIAPGMPFFTEARMNFFDLEFGGSAPGNPL